MVFLVVVMQQMDSMHHEILTGQNTGSSLLGEDTGGYVLAAVIAFIAGVIITAIIYKNRDKGQNINNQTDGK